MSTVCYKIKQAFSLDNIHSCQKYQKPKIKTPSRARMWNFGLFITVINNGIL